MMVAPLDFDTFIKVIELPDGTQVPESDQFQCKWAREAGRLDYDQKFIDRISKYIQPGNFVIDGGACIGTHTKVFSDLVGEDGLVLAIEPCRDNVRILEKNIPHFKHKDNVIFTNGFAIAHREGRGTFSYSPENIGESVMHWHKDGEVFFDYLDQLVPLVSPRKVDFIKLDIEGWEYLALIGAFEILKRDRPKLLVEINPTCLARMGLTQKMLLIFIDEMGYDWSIFTTEAIPEGGMFDILALPRPDAACK